MITLLLLWFFIVDSFEAVLVFVVDRDNYENIRKCAFLLMLILILILIYRIFFKMFYENYLRVHSLFVEIACLMVLIIQS